MWFIQIWEIEAYWKISNFLLEYIFVACLWRFRKAVLSESIPPSVPAMMWPWRFLELNCRALTIDQIIDYINRLGLYFRLSISLVNNRLSAKMVETFKNMLKSCKTDSQRWPLRLNTVGVCDDQCEECFYLFSHVQDLGYVFNDVKWMATGFGFNWIFLISSKF